ncbi:MAG: glycosyltransferase [Candidatus Cloacimonadaceae bacterium]|jgi:glycosyltransferase involved in cell wall biosynthesis|nr:glycosyltransferase [Candidatus Cloacimonadota bacterium]MCK9242739.1 glycosyltransferase [Candidatus Cloacimonadota bacterium]MDY0126640.1 glycosyltransferase [Candidatus Cloacimonadaceae bacterium]
MKIAFLGPAPPFLGGISQFASHLADELSSTGHEVCFFNFKHQYPALLFPAGRQEDDSQPKHTSQRVLTPYLPHTWPKTVKAINAWQPDLLIISWWVPFFAFAFGYIIRRIKFGRKLILAHNIVPHEPWPFTRSLLRYVFEPADNILLLSKSCLQDLRGWLPNRVITKSILGFHPIYETHQGKISKTNNQPGLLFFGLIKEYKGLDTLLEAMPIIRLAIPDINLQIAGSVYGDESVYSKQIERLGLTDCVKTDFRYISGEEVSEYFRQADVCILPYKSATQSGVIATAFSYDTPVIASDVGGLSEYIEDGSTGLLIPPEDPPALAAAVLRFYDQRLLSPMQEEIRAYKKSSTWTDLAKLILDR